MTHALTTEQIELARYALGLTRRPVSYRNYFVASPGHNDYAHWTAMVEAGMARKRSGGLGTAIGDDVFYLTRAGAEAALRPGERLDTEHWENK